MPKETISARPTLPLEGGGFIPEGEVELRWGKAGYFQMTTGKIEPDGISNTYYVQLDREGINDLIRKLRRARDYAFGKDA